VDDLVAIIATQLDEESMPHSRRGFLGWMVEAAAAVLVAGRFEAARSSVFSHPELRSEHAQPGAGVPPDMLVVVSTDGKTFHAPGCAFIHDKARIQTIAAREAQRAGYAPCIRCMKQYLNAADFAFGPVDTESRANPWNSWCELLQMTTGCRVLQHRVPLGISG
jgi:hypothetical protein